MAQRQSLVDGQELVSFHAQAIAWTPETVRQALEAEVKRNCCWSDEPVRDMEIRQLTQSDLWYVKLTSCVETRSMEEKKEIYQGGEVDKEGTPPDEWSMEVTPPEPFQEMTKCYRVPHSDVISQCEECDGRGDVACKRCDRKGWWWCKNCKGEKQIWCEESSDSSSSEAGGKGEDADGKGKGKDDGKGYRSSVEGKGEEPDGKGKGKEDGKGYRSSFEGKGDEPDGKGKGKEDGKGYRSSFEGKGDEPDGKGKGKEDGKGYRSSIAGKGEEADGKGKGKDEGKGYRSSKGSAQLGSL
ncbi:Ssuh2 [Symbiodinium natans]|uniref:Ssuh2 protein n=1 Tax=Symbiodinium natans TaxID=878477 RepID=A0A812P5M7_9DINO|nr:Ssuh2 [Symbiodinium natans]